MATTRIIPMHLNKGKTLAQCLADRTEYGMNPDKTEGGVLVFGTNAEFPPFEYVGDDGEPDGFDVALIKAVGEKLGMEVQVENMEFDSLVSSIGNRIDGAIAGMTVCLFLYFPSCR